MNTFTKWDAFVLIAFAAWAFNERSGWFVALFASVDLVVIPVVFAVFGVLAAWRKVRARL